MKFKETEIVFVRNQIDLFEFQMREGTSVDDIYYENMIKELNKRFSRYSKKYRFVVMTKKKYFFGLFVSEPKTFYVSAYSKKAAIKKVLNETL